VSTQPVIIVKVTLTLLDSDTPQSVFCANEEISLRSDDRGIGMTVQRIRGNQVVVGTGLEDEDVRGLVDGIDPISGQEQRRPGSARFTGALVPLFPHLLAGVEFDTLDDAIGLVGIEMSLVDYAGPQT
jgi:hypothetical protein